MPAVVLQAARRSNFRDIPAGSMLQPDGLGTSEQGDYGQRLVKVTVSHGEPWLFVAMIVNYTNR